MNSPTNIDFRVHLGLVSLAIGQDDATYQTTPTVDWDSVPDEWDSEDYLILEGVLPKPLNLIPIDEKYSTPRGRAFFHHLTILRNVRVQPFCHSRGPIRRMGRLQYGVTVVEALLKPTLCNLNTLPMDVQNSVAHSELDNAVAIALSQTYTFRSHGATAEDNCSYCERPARIVTAFGKYCLDCARAITPRLDSYELLMSQQLSAQAYIAMFRLEMYHASRGYALHALPGPQAMRYGLDTQIWSAFRYGVYACTVTGRTCMCSTCMEEKSEISGPMNPNYHQMVVDDIIPSPWQDPPIPAGDYPLPAIRHEGRPRDENGVVIPTPPPSPVPSDFSADWSDAEDDGGWDMDDDDDDDPGCPYCGGPHDDCTSTRESLFDMARGELQSMVDNRSYGWRGAQARLAELDIGEKRRRDDEDEDALDDEMMRESAYALLMETYGQQFCYPCDTVHDGECAYMRAIVFDPSTTEADLDNLCATHARTAKRAKHQ